MHSCMHIHDTTRKSYHHPLLSMASEARNEDDIIPPPLFYSVRVQSFALLPTNSKATRQIFGSDCS